MAQATLSLLGGSFHDSGLNAIQRCVVQRPRGISTTLYSDFKECADIQLYFRGKVAIYIGAGKHKKAVRAGELEGRKLIVTPPMHEDTLCCPAWMVKVVPDDEEPTLIFTYETREWSVSCLGECVTFQEAVITRLEANPKIASMSTAQRSETFWSFNSDGEVLMLTRHAADVERKDPNDPKRKKWAKDKLDAHTLCLADSDSDADAPLRPAFGSDQAITALAAHLLK